MRVIRFLGFLLTMATAIAVSAIVASEITASAHQTDGNPERAFQQLACPQSATAQSTIELDVRVTEVNVSKLKALGFDFWSIRGPNVPWEQQITGIVGSGVGGFLDALDREGLVQQDLSLLQQVGDGDSWQRALRWRVPDAKGTESAWRTLRLHVRPTSLDAEKIRLETACGAQFSKNRPEARHAEDNTMVDFTAEVDRQMLCLNANFVAADPDQFPKDEIRVFVLITPHVHRASQEHSQSHSRADLLAPRNVLGP